MLNSKTFLGAALAGVALVATLIQAQSPDKPPLKTAVYDWSKFQPEPTKSGERQPDPRVGWRMVNPGHAAAYRFPGRDRSPDMTLL